MNHKLTINALIFLSIYFLISCTNSTQEDQEKKEKRKPNIIFILADDLGYGDLGVYGQKVIKTPYIDDLAAKGMRFTQFYAGSTVCAPSRCALLTGMHIGHAKVRGNATVPLDASDNTFAEALQKAGYVTGIIGKWGLGEDGSSGIPNKKGFDYFYGYLNQIRAHNYYPDFVWENEQQDSLGNVVELIPESYAKGVGGVSTNKDVYVQDKFLEKTLDFIQSYQDSSFMLYLPYTLPHANNESWFYKESGMEIPDYGQYAQNDWPDDQKGHAAMISRLDKDVGIIMNELEVLGLEENTLVIFTSDNGPHDEGGADYTFFDSNGPLRGLKRDLYEGGIRVPMIAYWPGKIKANTTSDLISAFWDVFPTFCDIAQIEAPQNIDGISFLPTLLGQEQPKHEYLYWEFYEKGGRQAIRLDNWKGVRMDMTANPDAPIELYNIAEDTSEQYNIASEQPELIERMTQIFKKEHTYSDDFNFEYERNATN